MAVYRTLLYFGKPSCSSRVSQLPFDLYSKRRYGTTVAEALATQFVQENTSIPVPTIYHHDSNPYNRLGGEYIIMSKVFSFPAFPRSGQ